MINSSVAFPERCSSISLKIGSFWSLFLSHVLLVCFTGIFVSRYLLLLCFYLLFFIIFIVLFILWEFHIMSFDHIQFLLSSQLLPHPPPHPPPQLLFPHLNKPKTSHQICAGFILLGMRLSNGLVHLQGYWCLLCVLNFCLS